MIVVDSSAVVAALQDEPEAARIIEIIGAEDRSLMSAVSVYETAIVMNSRSGEEGVADVFDFIESSRIEIHPFSPEMISIAVAAYQRFGRGSGSKAKLNFGDCISYAFARSLDVPLLFKGDDFAATDLRGCL